MRLADFATERKPLRASLLPMLTRCPWMVVMKCFAEGDDTGGPAAETGSLIHLGIDHWHKNERGTVEAVAAMKEGLALYPQADLTAAADQFLAYAQDARNAEAEIVFCEEAIETSIETEAGEEAFVIRGTLDQVRRIAGQLVLIDVKTGKFHQGHAMLNEHAYQLAAYQVGASEKLGEPINKVSILRTQDYLRSGPVFWEGVWSLADARKLLQTLGNIVLSIRRGRLWIGPGVHCGWCPSAHPSNCFPRLLESR